MHKVVRQLADQAALIGWSCDGRLDGRGHYTFTHEDGHRYPVPCSPSEYRSMKNALADLERISGRRVPRAGKRRKSHKAAHGSGFDIAAAKRETASWRREQQRQARADAESRVEAKALRAQIDELSEAIGRCADTVKNATTPAAAAPLRSYLHRLVTERNALIARLTNRTES